MLETSCCVNVLTPQRSEAGTSVWYQKELETVSCGGSLYESGSIVGGAVRR